MENKKYYELPEDFQNDHDIIISERGAGRKNKKYIVWRLINGKARNQLMNEDEIVEIVGPDFDVVPTEHGHDWIIAGNGEYFGIGTDHDGNMTHHSLFMDQEVFIHYVEEIKQEAGYGAYA